MTTITTSSRRKRAIGIKHGFRSGLEDRVSKQITEAGIKLLYETDKVHYVIPSRDSKYTPDFKLPKPGGFFYVETKGLWTVQDRAKHMLIQRQRPGIDIRFIFSNQKAKLYKGSPTTYGMYCDKHGLVYANKLMPQEWLEEAKCLELEE